MSTVYTPPLRDQQFVLHELLNSSQVYSEIPKYKGIDSDTINQIIEAAGTFCSEVLYPINAIGDQQGCILNTNDHSIKTPDGFKAAYDLFVKGGWNGLTADPAYGGQGLPRLLDSVLFEMQYASNQAWAMYPGLAHGVYMALNIHATIEQKQRFLPKLVSGECLGTMCLTEPHCGTDLGLIKTRAIPDPNPANNQYFLTGNKIFISAGEHDLSNNIIHLVLAKLPNAPEGSKGISLFIVPKFNVDNLGNIIKNSDGSYQRNSIYCTGLEHKMGINGNATCQLSLENAIGYLVSEPNKGLQAMFVMMNGARLGVGMQGLGITTLAYQKAVAYAKDRLQGRSLSGIQSINTLADPIIVHPDVRRALLTARAYSEGGRAVGYWVAQLIDQSHDHPDTQVRQHSELLLGLMTPIVKAFMTDNGFNCASDCLGVFGGHGYLRDWGIEQLVRDARINMIYEGTNAIQSIDLLGRKILKDHGAALSLLDKKIDTFLNQVNTNSLMLEFTIPLTELKQTLFKLTTQIGIKSMTNSDEMGAASVDYLRIIGHVVYGYFWAKMANIALIHIQSCQQNKQAIDSFYTAKLHTAQFYFQKLMPETNSCIKRIQSGANSIMTMPNELF